jgi:flagellar assembly protein FliH
MSLLHKGDMHNSDRITSWSPADFQPLEEPQTPVIDVDSLLSDFTSGNNRSIQQDGEDGEGLLVNLPGQRTRYMNVKPWAFENLDNNGHKAGNNRLINGDKFLFEELTPIEADHIQNNGFHQQGHAWETASNLAVENEFKSQDLSDKNLESEPPTPLELAQEQADKILEAAQQEAERIIQNANEAVAQITQNAYQEGLTQAKSEMDSGLQQVSSILNTAVQWREQVLSQSEATIIEMVKQIARRIFGEEFELDRYQLQSHFAQVMEYARAMGDLKVYLHPEDAQMVGPDWRDNQMMISGQNIQLLPSSALQRGGCYIEGDLGTVDARVGTQLENVLEAIDDVAKSGATNGSSKTA